MTMDTPTLRAALRRELGAEIFEPQPIRGVIALVEAALVVAAGVFLVWAHPPAWVALPISLGMGQLLTAMGLSAHEAMHGAVFRTRWLRQLLAWVGFAPLLVTPGMWVAWHVQAHHGHTNRVKLDPDALFELEAYSRSWLARARARMTLGAEAPWLSALSQSVLFSVQGQLFLWFQCDEPGLRDKVTLDRTRERALTVGLAIGWLTLGWVLGWPDALWVLVIPMATQNLTLMAYISTQHWLQPQVTEDDPIRSTVSVIVPRWMDWLHFGFSNHQEHHLFPRMSHRFAPLVRATAERLSPGTLTRLPWWRVLREVHRTPVLYRDPTTLCSADGRRVVALEPVVRALGEPGSRTRRLNPGGP